MAAMRSCSAVVPRLRLISALSVATMGAVMSYRDAYLDLDPTYRDALGQPLLRMTFNWHENEYRLAAHANAKARSIVEAMKPKSIGVNLIKPGENYDVRRYQSTHTTGGAISFFTKKPKLAGDEGYFTIGYANYDTKTVEGGFAFVTYDVKTGAKTPSFDQARLEPGTARHAIRLPAQP